MKLTDNITVSDLLDMYGMFLTGGVDPQHVKIAITLSIAD